MTKVQILAVLAAMGGAFTAGSVLDYSPGTLTAASVTYPHALRLEHGLLEDGGLAPGADRLIAYRTRATGLSDGGLELEDLGPADCAADTAELRTYVRNNCRKADGGPNLAVYVVEIRPTTLEDGGAGIDVQSYGEETVHCTGNKTPLLRTFIRSLDCTAAPRRSQAAPL